MSTDSDVWTTDPVTLRDVVLDMEAMQARLEDCPELERIWILSLLDRTLEAIEEGIAGGNTTSGDDLRREFGLPPR